MCAGCLVTAAQLASMPAFVDAQLALCFRLEHFPSEFHAGATFGPRVAPKWLLLAQSFNVISEGGRGPLAPSCSYCKLQLGAVYNVTSAPSLQRGTLTTYAGHNALEENGLITGL